MDHQKIQQYMYRTAFMPAGRFETVLLDGIHPTWLGCGPPNCSIVKSSDSVNRIGYSLYLFRFSTALVTSTDKLISSSRNLHQLAD